MSVTSYDSINSEISEISQLTGLNIWQESQETLEKQALQEIEQFSNKKKLEDGEIPEYNIESSKPADVILDIQALIQKQEKLKKIQEHKKLLQVSEKSRLVANKIVICKENNKLQKKIQKGNSKANVKAKKRKYDDLTKSLNEESCSSNDDKIKSSIKRKLKLKRSSIKDEVCEDESCCSEEETINDNAIVDSILSDDEDYVPSDASSDEWDGKKCKTKNVKKQNKESNSHRCLKVIKDDGCIESFKARLNLYYKTLENDDCEKLEDVVLKRGLKIPAKTWANMYSYQQEGVEWLWKLHQGEVGGLLGDEMGLGKTVQIIVFLMALQHSAISGRFRGLGPTLIVCPATVLYQWVQHFHDWAPEIRVAVLHHSGSFAGNKYKLIKEINKDGGVIISTYSGILKYKGNLIEHNWHYLILDEGHKIRNPSAKVTVAVKHFRTPHRLLLTGSPMQNNLQELWSLFDFIIPGILGTLQTFVEHFANPIIQGGYYNSTKMQEATAQSVAAALKEIISPYLLRRSKAEVQRCIQLPYKSEQVLFCSLTEEQYDLYKGFLMSDHVNQILGRGEKKWFSDNYMRANVLVAIMTLRKICNHPDLYLEEANDMTDMLNESLLLEERLDFHKRSGKMIVVSALLKMWKKQKHRVLLFTQTRGMITIFEAFLKHQGYNYLKMDGSTSVTSRQSLIDKFNKDESLDVFLLTTRVGGLGVNLTGANRVIIYDPDWNPATDTQARERAWRIGQEKQVTVYRLVSAGTIEEKMYQRQVWKQLLSNKVLIDPKTQKFFKTSDLHDLFSLHEQTKYSKAETTNIFKESMINIQERLEQKKLKKKIDLKNKLNNKEENAIEFSEEKIEQMKKLAKQIAQSVKKNECNSKPSKSTIHVEIEEEREKRLREKEKIKKLTPTELLIYNRKKLEPKEEAINTVDDNKLDNFTFEKALQHSENTAILYNNLKTGKLKEEELLAIKSESCKSSISNEGLKNGDQKVHKKKKKSVKVDTTGKVEGEKIEGLVKREVKKLDKIKLKNEKQDSFILEKLFAKKGVHSALKHDEVVGTTSSSEIDRIRIRSEAKRKADLALEALRKSRLKKWRW